MDFMDSEDAIRKRHRDRRDREEAEAAAQKEGQGTHSQDYLDKLNELLERAEPLIVQVNSLYNQYAQGVELRPPRERHNQLEQVMSSLMMMAKPTPSYRFRYQSVAGMYNTYKQRWQKLMLAIDSGKVVRKVKPRTSAA